MTDAPTIPKEETTEGNVTEIDLENRHLLIEDRIGTPFMKLFWHKAQEEFDGKSTALFNQIRKLQPGYYVAPVIKDVDTSASGKIKEAYLVALPFKKRPEDFPRPQQKRGGSGGRTYVPRNEKPPIYGCCYKECAETARALLVLPDQVFNEVQADRVMDWVLKRAKHDAAELCKEAGA